MDTTAHRIPTTPAARKRHHDVLAAWRADPRSAPALLAPDDAAALVGVSRRSIDRWWRAGLIRASKPAGGRVLVHRDSLLAFCGLSA